MKTIDIEGIVVEVKDTLTDGLVIYRVACRIPPSPVEPAKPIPLEHLSLKDIRFIAGAKVVSDEDVALNKWQQYTPERIVDLCIDFAGRYEAYQRQFELRQKHLEFFEKVGLRGVVMTTEVEG